MADGGAGSGSGRVVGGGGGGGKGAAGMSTTSMGGGFGIGETPRCTIAVRSRRCNPATAAAINHRPGFVLACMDRSLFQTVPCP
jgi:hypothetical protein